MTTRWSRGYRPVRTLRVGNSMWLDAARGSCRLLIPCCRRTHSFRYRVEPFVKELSGTASKNAIQPKNERTVPLSERRIFYGWPMSAVAWLLYGLGVMPFYTWGFLLPEMLEELGLSRAQGGLAFGVGLLAGGLASPLVGVALTRFGARRTMTAGYLASAIGYYLTSQAQGLWSLVLVYGVFAMMVNSFAVVLPTQTLASTWFVKYRARVLAGLLTAGGVMAPLIYRLNAWLVVNATWRIGWVVVAVLCVVLGMVAYAVIRDAPESVGQLPDGAKDQAEIESSRPKGQAKDVDLWTAREAIRTPQFLLMLICGLGYAVPWYVLNNHSRLHLQDTGLEVEVIAAILGSMALVSTLGRLSGALGDFISPPRLLGLALLLEGLGLALFTYASTSTQAYVAVIFVGLGFGMAYITQAATFALFFGRQAFATTTGIRFMVGALFTSSVPALVGWWFDTRGSYTLAFLAVAAVSVAGAVIALTIRAPQRHLA